MRSARDPLSRRRSQFDEQGAVAIIVALAMVMLLIVVAMVLDFGIVRVDRQANKSAADSATLAGLRGLDMGDGLAHPYVGVCQAVRYLQTNDPELSGLTGSWSDGNGASQSDGCTTAALADVTCTPGNQSTWARFVGTDGSGRISVRIQSGYLLTDGGFPEENLPALQTDTGDAAQQGCDHLAVIISETRKPGLGSLATSSDLVSRIRSVGRVQVGEEGQGAVALLLLERSNCNVLDADGAGSGILVHGNGDMPGMIHVDSLGNGSDCTSNKILNGNHPNGIVAEQAETGSPVADAILSVRALSRTPGAVPGNASDPYPDVIAQPSPPNEPTGRGLITRSPVDNRWLNGVRTVVNGAAANWLTPPAASPGAVAWETNCTGGSGPSNAATLTAPVVVFDCADAGKNYPDVTLAANKVIFRQGLWISSNFKMPNASEVYVGGVPGGAAISVKNNASFQMHTAGRTVSPPLGFSHPLCTDANTSGRGKLVIGAGNIEMSASTAHMQMCNTTTVMMGNQTDGCLPASTPTPPTTNLCDSFINVTGGDLDWTAPDELDAIPAGQEAANWDQLEDLAFWSEAEDNSNSTNHRIMGGGAMHLAGVFMIPNANPVIIGGGGTQLVERSQYVARRLTVNGGGTLDMQPDPQDSFTIPIIGGFELVR